ncbi:MAG: DUF1330 domain-containing protein [Pseudomonadota bacterium]
MPKGYWFVRMDVHDQDNYVKEYVARNAKPIAEHGGKFLVRGGQSELFEGTQRARSVVVEFPSYQAALDCAKSADYQEAVAHRRKYAEGDFLVIEGYEGPQPGDQ